MSTKNQRRKARLLKKTNEESIQEPVQEQKQILSEESQGIPRDVVLDKADELWKVLKNYARANPTFRDLKEQEKLDIFRHKFNYGAFMDEFPIVSRYMICYGQYSRKAFDRMLFKIEKTVHPPPEKREKNYMEDQWVMRQADYVQYLWEAYQKTHYNPAEKKYIWQSTYERLKKEFDDFRNMHKEVEEKVKLERKELAGQNVRELLERHLSGKQKLSEEEELFLLAALKEAAARRGEVEIEEPKPAEKDPKILMIETVDVERMGEIADEYRPPELRGMEPIIESQSETNSEEFTNVEMPALTDSTTDITVD